MFANGAVTGAFAYAMSAVASKDSQTGGNSGDDSSTSTDPHAGHEHSGPGGNPNPDGITQQEMIDGDGTWTVNEADVYHQKGVDPDFPNVKWNDTHGHEEVFDHKGVPVRNHNGPTFNRHNGNLNPLHLLDIYDWKVNGTGWPSDNSTSSERCVFINC